LQSWHYKLPPHTKQFATHCKHGQFILYKHCGYHPGKQSLQTPNLQSKQYLSHNWQIYVIGFKE